MAVIRTGSIVSDIRGSVGDETYSRNKGGLYVRARVDPAQPASAERDLRQAALTAISQHWSASLTSAQRVSWRGYAAQHFLPNRWGTLSPRSGYVHFVRCNFQHYRVLAAVAFNTPPAQPPMHMPEFTLEANAAASWLRVWLPLTNYPDPVAADRYFLYCGADASAGRSYYSSPFRYRTSYAVPGGGIPPAGGTPPRGTPSPNRTSYGPVSLS